MSYGFDDNMGKVPIEPILDNLQTAFQNNINKIYNAIKNQGTTPPGKTPDNIVTGINNLATNKWNAGKTWADGRSDPSTYNYQSGYSAAQNVSWSQSFYFDAGAYNEGGISGIPRVEMGLRNVTSGSITGANITMTIRYFNSAGTEVGSQDITGGSGTLSIPSTAQKMEVSGNTFMGRAYCYINLNYKCQVLR